MNRYHQLIDHSTNAVLLERVEAAKNWPQRLRGLMMRRGLGSDALWIEPCASIHTMWVRFSIDVYFIDATGRILGKRKNLAPWRVALAPKGTRAVLEVPTGGPELETGICVRLAPVP